MPLILRGKIIVGIGVGGSFVGLEWVKRQIRDKIGFEPYVGTLNLKVDEENLSKYHSYLQSRRGIPIEPVDDSYYAGKCHRVRINERVDGAIVVPLVPNYPHDQMEIIAPVNLREVLGLKEGSEITIELLDN